LGNLEVFRLLELLREEEEKEKNANLCSFFLNPEDIKILSIVKDQGSTELISDYGAKSVRL
jgi:hypothetical protein